MARKLNKAEQADRTEDSLMVEEVRDSVDQIWQAGLGAFAKAQQEGEDMFSKLVQEGIAVQKRTQALAGEQLSGLSETVANMAESLGRQASGSWEKLESVFEDRVSQALRGMGVPTHDDIEALGERIGELHEMVNALIAKKDAGKAAAKKPAAKAVKKQAVPKAAKKPAAKRGARSSVRKAAAPAANRV